MGNTTSSQSDGEGLREPSQMESVFKNHMLLAELVQYLEIRDLLTLRQVNSASDRLSTWRLRRIGTPVKDLKSDEDIDKFRADTANAPHPLPFSAFSLDLTTISMDGIDKFLELQDAIRSLSIVHNPEEQDGITGEWIRQIYTENMVGAKLGRVLTALAHTLRTLRLKFFADVTLGGDEESSLFPLELPALETLEAVYFQPNRELGGDLVGHLANCAENLDHLAIHRHHDHTVNFTENLNERIPGLLFGRERSIPPSLSLDTNIRIADLPILQLLNQRGYNRIRKLNLGLFAYHLCQEVAPTIYGNFLQRLSELLSLQAASLEDLLLVTDHVDTVQERGSTDQIQLPLVMKKLQRIALYFPQKEAGVASPIASFTAGQFPQLAHVDLGFDHGWFNGLVFSTVTSLEVNYESELSDHGVIFPSLKRLLFYAQDPSTVVGDILKRDGGRVEVLGCFGLGNRITSLQHKAALARFSKSTLGDLNARVPDEHILGNFFGISFFVEVSNLKKGLSMWQRFMISHGPKAKVVSNWRNLRQVQLTIFTKEESEKVETLCKNGEIPMFQECGIWLLPADAREHLQAQNLGRYHEVTVSIDLGHR